MKVARIYFAVIAAASPALLYAQSLDGPRTWTVEGIRITEGDYTTCPYHVVGHIRAALHGNMVHGVREHTTLSETVERARKYGADAVVHFVASAEHSTTLFPRSRTISGEAIKFVAPCVAAAR